MSILNEFNRKFKVDEFTIHESKYWTWSLRSYQATLGAGILSLKRECLAFSELRKEEFANLKSIIKVIEHTLHKAFNYDVINYLMLMMFDKHVHYHILPRYEKPVEFLAAKWEDDSWPNIPKLIGEDFDKKLLDEIVLYIKNMIDGETIAYEKI
jgi:diadenosine tetraphosphate (Ap4A) HIT family hydrolase